MMAGKNINPEMRVDLGGENRFMSAVLGLAAGVMIFVSFVELFAQAEVSLGFGWAQAAFFLGMAVMGISLLILR